MSDVTQLLVRIESGDSKAASELFPLVYNELRRLASWHMANEKRGQTLQATALVHEAFLRLVGGDTPILYSGRKGFFSAAAEAMRHILVDVARRKLAQKRGGNVAREDIELESVEIDKPDELLAIHDALDAFSAHDSDTAEIVVMHYFGGFSLAEIAEIKGISRATANRKWTYARIWLRANLHEAE